MPLWLPGALEVSQSEFQDAIRHPCWPHRKAGRPSGGSQLGGEGGRLPSPRAGGWGLARAGNEMWHCPHFLGKGTQAWGTRCKGGPSESCSQPGEPCRRDPSVPTAHCVLGIPAWEERAREDAWRSLRGSRAGSEVGWDAVRDPLRPAGPSGALRGSPGPPPSPGQGIKATCPPPTVIGSDV